MSQQITLPGWPLTGQSTISLKIEVTAQINISAYVARQKANRYLIMQAGDQLCAGEPELVAGVAVAWRVPVQCAPSKRGVLGTVGHLLIDATTGEVTIADRRTTEDLLKGAETLYERASLSVENLRGVV
ncbi:MAG: hypothetical protein HY870_23930 [Chloroflexi bacterium]|nr:hypothetical protein [Chloroflexota bacterium]